MFDNQAFNKARREAGVTITEFADFAGISRRSARQIELCREPAGPWAFAVINAIMADRGADWACSGKRGR